MTTLAKLFERLTPPLDNGDLTFVAAPLPEQQHHLLGKDSAAAPCLLFSVQETTSRPAPIRLEHLSVEHNARCTIHTSGAITEGHFTIIRCHDARAPLQDLFLRFAEPLIRKLQAHPTPDDIHRTVTAIVELFRAATQPAMKTVQGLWSELFVIAQADNPGILLQAWHNTPDDRYDFATGPQRIEIKSTSTRVRQHTFSLEQLSPPAGTRVIIASLFAERSAGGTAIADLLDTIGNAVRSATLLADAQRTAYLSLGDNWREGMTTRFDRELATASLRYIDAANAPSIPGPLPPGVTQVRFSSDLTNAPTLSTNDLQAAGGLHAAARPRKTAQQP